MFSKILQSIRKFFSGEEKKNTEKKGLTDENLVKLKKQYSDFMEEVSKEAENQNSTNKERREKHDTVCPKCKSKNVNDRIKRFQGNINGQSSGSGWNALSFGESHSSGYIKGKFDTSEVNKCNDCENEWKKWDGDKYVYKNSVISQKLMSIRLTLSALKDAREVKWDKLDLKEKFNSLEEKRTDALAQLKDNTWLKTSKRFWTNYSLELIEKLFEEFGKGYDLRTWKECYDYKFLREDIGLKHIEEF